MFVMFPPDHQGKKEKKNQTVKILKFIYVLILIIILGRFLFRDLLIYFPPSLVNFILTVSEYSILYYVIILGWIPILIYAKLSPEALIIFKSIHNEIEKKAPWKTLFSVKNAYFNIMLGAQTFTKTKSTLEKISTNNNLKFFFEYLKKQYRWIKPIYIWQLKNHYIISGSYYEKNNKVRKLFTTYYSDSTNYSSSFEITPNSFFSSFSKSISTGDSSLDSKVKINALDNSNKKQIIQDINNIGVTRILNFIQTDGLKIVATQGKVFWVKKVKAKDIPTIKYNKNDYNIMQHGVDINDNVINTNLKKFQNYIESQIIK